MNGMPVSIKPLSLTTCLRGVWTVNGEPVFGIDVEEKIPVVSSLLRSLPKCELAQFGICSQHSNRGDG